MKESANWGDLCLNYHEMGELEQVVQQIGPGKRMGEWEWMVCPAGYVESIEQVTGPRKRMGGG